jgi:hypothetical protein
MARTCWRRLRCADFSNAARVGATRVQDDVIAGSGRDVVVVAQRVGQGLHELEQPLPARRDVALCWM